MAHRTARLASLTPPLFALGFRPFFLVAAVAAFAGMSGWLAMLEGWLAPPPYYGVNAWHAHLMLFGYTAAVIAGFLLTAVRNWTGFETPRGWWLAGLVGLWLAARVSPFLPLPGGLIAVVDLAFFPTLALALVRPLWQGANRANRVFLLLLAGMAVASALVHLDLLGVSSGLASRGHRLMLDLTILTLLLVAGRVMPFFTESAIAGARPRSLPIVERATFALATLVVVADLVTGPGSPWAGAVALLLAIVQVFRLWLWYQNGVWRLPILWVLYTGYVWLIAGLMLNGLAALGLVPAIAVLHSLTVGAVGVFTLGMMARVALGHTGRAMQAAAPTVLAFVLVNLAALVRVALPLIDPSRYSQWLVVSGLFWLAGFAAFLWVYTPILIAPRADGRPG